MDHQAALNGVLGHLPAWSNSAFNFFMMLGKYAIILDPTFLEYKVRRLDQNCGWKTF